MEGDEGNAREASAVNPRSEEGGACGDFDDVDDVGCSSETVEGSSARESGEIEDLCPAERRRDEHGRSAHEDKDGDDKEAHHSHPVLLARRNPALESRI